MSLSPEHAGLRWVWLPLTAAVVGIGVWVTGGVLTNDEQLAKGLTALWFTATGLVAAFIAWRDRQVAAPVLLGYGVAAVGLGGFLLYTSTVDRVVDEDVVVADGAGATPSAGSSPSTRGESSDGENTNELLARGSFSDGEHPTDGVAAVVRTPDRRVLTLTMFATDPGPDLRVYFVPAGVEDADGVDLGALKGNKGDQQYSIPEGIDLEEVEDASVVIWCRAFSVAFGTAEMEA